MKDYSLAKLLFISGFLFFLFLLFVYFVLQSLVDQSSSTSPLASLGDGKKVGVVEINGIILAEKKILESLARFEKDSSIRGVILRLNSPGGVVAPSQEIHDAVLRLRKKKPVVTSVMSLAASGAYYVAVASNSIVANPGSVVGSIGVIVEFADLSKLYSWLKIRRYNIKSGPYKDIGSDFRRMTKAEKRIFQSLVDEIHQQFVQAVANGRRLKLSRVQELAKGQVFTGVAAKKLNLVDRVGGLHEAVEAMMKLANLRIRPRLVYPSPERKNILTYLRENALFSSILAPFIAFFQKEKHIPEGSPLFLAPGFSP